MTKDNVPSIFSNPAFMGSDVDAIRIAAEKAVKDKRKTYLVVTGSAKDREWPSFKLFREVDFTSQYVFAINEKPNQFTELVRR
jgi:hypothetical protein